MVIGGTAAQMQAAMPTMTTNGMVTSSEVWCHIIHSRHVGVNVRGTFNFAFEEYGVLWWEEGGGSALRAQMHWGDGGGREAPSRSLARRQHAVESLVSLFVRARRLPAPVRFDAARCGSSYMGGAQSGKLYAGGSQC